jgi:hypothetical protein
MYLNVKDYLFVQDGGQSLEELEQLSVPIEDAFE